MKRTNFAILKIFVAFSLALSSFQVWGDSKSRSTFTVNPVTLRSQLLEGNTSVMIGLNSVAKAKEEVNSARARLLPSFDGSLIGTGGFSLATVSFLLPFLFPSNWSNLRANERQLAADGYAYYLVKLNQYASAYSLYETILGDMDLLSAYRAQANNYSQIEDVVEAKVILGLATDSDLRQAKAQTQLTRAQALQTDQLVAQEIASIRKMLGLSLQTQIVMEKSHPSALAEESRSDSSLLEKTFSSSPEYLQIESLVAAGKSRTWSRVFGWLTGASLNVPTGNGALETPTVVGRINLGFELFPAVRLSQLNVEELRLRRRELKLEHARILESTLKSLDFATEQYRFAQAAESNIQAAYDAKLEAYRAGTGIDLLFLLNAASSLTASSVARARAQTNLDTQRVSLSRVLITGQFRRIKDCKLNARNDLGGWISGIFKRSTISIDELCGE